MKGKVRKRESACSGLSMLEVALGVAVGAVLLLATTMSFTGNIRSTFGARERTNGTLFLETVLEDLSGQPFDNLLSLNGSQVFDETDALDSRFAVRLTVFPAEVNLVQVRADLTDLRTGREVARITTLRSGA